MTINPKLARDLLLPGLADILGKVGRHVDADLQMNGTGGLDIILSCLPDVPHGHPTVHFELLSARDFVDDRYKWAFGPACLAAVRTYVQACELAD